MADGNKKISEITIYSKESGTSVEYITTTNLSTIKSQISKGRQLVIKKIESKLKHLDENGLTEENLD